MRLFGITRKWRSTTRYHSNDKPPSSHFFITLNNWRTSTNDVHALLSLSSLIFVSCRSISSRYEIPMSSCWINQADNCRSSYCDAYLLCDERGEFSNYCAIRYMVAVAVACRVHVASATSREIWNYCHWLHRVIFDRSAAQLRPYRRTLFRRIY